MADLSLSQIQNRLNELFVGYGERKLIFWFDPKKEFLEDIENQTITLDNAKIKIVAPHTQIMTKHFFELEEKEDNYLIYAPFAKLSDDDENNHLLSLLKYSQIFSADRISLVMTQLNIPNQLYDIMEKYSKFFGAKARVSAFEKLVSRDITSKEELELAIMAVLTKANTPQLYSVVQSLMVEYAKEESTSAQQLENFGLSEAFWHYIHKYYGYAPKQPTIQKLIISFFVNAFYGQRGQLELPASLKEYEVLEQTTAIISFMDGVLNDARYQEDFDQLSGLVYRLIGGNQLLAKAPIEELIATDIFEAVHLKVMKYYLKQLVSGNRTPVISGLSMAEVLTKKKRSHFGEKYGCHYDAILYGQKILNFVSQHNQLQFSEVVTDYEKNSYLLDQYYRKFIWNLDQLENDDEFNELTDIIEKEYKDFLDEVGRKWNQLLNLQERPSILDFYGQFASNKVKTVIIVSDALRYEIAKELENEIQVEKKYATQISTLFSTLPSVTEFGKAALIKGPHESYIYTSGTEILVNELKTNGTINRDKILKQKNSNSLAITYEEVMAKENAKDLRELFNGQEIIYLFHDQIDRTGDHGQEAQVFDAAERTIAELQNVIQRISNGANVYRFIITSDHGFIYTRSKIEEHEKIENPSLDSDDRVERRFIISNHQYEELGIKRVKLGEALHNDDSRFIHFPETSAIFKKAGGGQNYVHGGSSPQEMLVPVLEIIVSRGSAQKEAVAVRLMTTKRKIIGLSVALEFYQTEALSDTITKSQYALYFEDKTGNRISNENAYYADATTTSASERFSNFTFDFVNRSYEMNEKVYLIMKNSDTQIEEERVEFVIDNPFAGDFKFDF